jgi:hypothetical protein
VIFYLTKVFNSGILYKEGQEMSDWNETEAFYSTVIPQFVGNDMSKDRFLVIRGTLHWAKLTGKARPYTGNPKYNKGPYWSVDVAPDAKSLAAMKAEGIADKLRSPKPDDKAGRKDKFLTLRVLENKADGEKNQSPKIIDVEGNAWDGRLLGNGTVADVRVKVKDYDGAPTGVYLQAVRVLSLVPYESNDFEPLSEDDEFFSADAPADMPYIPSRADEDLDDDIPF